ncbi:Cdc6-related protein, AAA superfamily ATPase [Halovenus aranensis]|uniref:Cdc6-related protein, AAA superfamily ATPase n=1 Tax=Halovenus aranensis TaxID=890420 RepID=A0A1G8STE2_9EURY|nr:AAA family ATPase [Halovenus aranensis]SDJ32507.1 Cdc6-related protein, AAA superfamily ATPase [Halovenus aranensis]
MITDPEVVEPDYLPRRLLHRDHEADHLLRCWAAGEDVLLHGRSGVGKTTLLKHTLDRYREQTGTQCAFIPCLNTTAGVIRQVLTELPGADPGKTTPQEDLCLELRERITQPTNLVLDEANDLVDTDALRRLDDVDGISITAVVHHPDKWLGTADPETRRRFQGRELAVEPFSVTELADILERRAAAGLRDHAVYHDQLRDIADQVAGNARRGIQILRAAAELARRRGHERILDEDIDDADELAERRILEHNLRSLTFHHKLIYEIIRCSAGIAKGEFHDRYDEVADEIYHGRPISPLSKRSRNRKIRLLRDYGLVRATAENRHGDYAVVNSSVIPAIDVPELVD